AETEWHELRTQLEATGLIRAESLSHLGVGVPFLKFHPTLAPAMLSRLTEPEQQQLLSRYRQRYYQLSGYLYFEDDKNPFFTRAIAQRELPNLLYAVRGSIAAGEDFAVDFVDKVNKHLYIFGLNQDRENLTEMAQHMGGEVGSQTWYLTRSNTGEQLCNAGRYAEAEAVFQEILTGLGATPSYNRCVTLGRLGRCYRSTGQPERAAATYRLGLEGAAMLEQSDGVKRQMGLLQTDLGDVLRAMGDYDRARESYEASLVIKAELSDRRGEAVTQNQLGTLALVQKNLTEAAQRYQETLDPAAAQIWTIYNTLAKISDQQGDPAKAKEYRRLSRTARANFAGTEYELRQHAPLIEAVVRAVDDAEVRQQLEPMLEDMISRGWQNLIAAIRQILNGERDEDILCEGLNDINSQIVLAILGQVKR
ncbi:MAG: tetratricopeptide repeat protein, partial [Pseudanabaena sp.]